MQAHLLAGHPHIIQYLELLWPISTSFIPISHTPMHVFGIISFMLRLFIITYCDLEISQDKTNTTSRLLLHQELQQHLFRCVLWNQKDCSHCGSFCFLYSSVSWILSCINLLDMFWNVVRRWWHLCVWSFIWLATLLFSENSEFEALMPHLTSVTSSFVCSIQTAATATFCVFRNLTVRKAHTQLWYISSQLHSTICTEIVSFVCSLEMELLGTCKC